MTTLAINIAIYTTVFFLVGIIKPDFALFFMKNPNRITVLVLTLVLGMICVTLYGEGMRQKKLETETSTQQELPLADVPK